MFRTDAQQARGFTMADTWSSPRGWAVEGRLQKVRSAAPLAEPPAAERPGGFFFGGRQYSCSGQVAGQVAQLVEHATENRGVGGSIPPLATVMGVGRA